jgi:hypothetical protein
MYQIDDCPLQKNNAASSTIYIYIPAKRDLLSRGREAAKQFTYHITSSHSTGQSRKLSSCPAQSLKKGISGQTTGSSSSGTTCGILGDCAGIYVYIYIHGCVCVCTLLARRLLVCRERMSHHIQHFDLQDAFLHRPFLWNIIRTD